VLRPAAENRRAPLNSQAPTYVNAPLAEHGVHTELAPDITAAGNVPVPYAEKESGENMTNHSPVQHTTFAAQPPRAMKGQPLHK